MSRTVKVPGVSQAESSQRGANFTEEHWGIKPQAASARYYLESEDTKEEKLINHRAMEMASSATMAEFREIYDSLDPRLVRDLEAEGVDPIIHHIRGLAEHEVQEEKLQKKREAWKAEAVRSEVSGQASDQPTPSIL